jgi:hypothetical protein
MLHLAASTDCPAAGAADSHLIAIALLLLLLLLQSSPVYTMGSIGWPQPGTGCGASKVWVMAAPNAMQSCLTMLSACCWVEKVPVRKQKQPVSSCIHLSRHQLLQLS